MKPRVTRGPSQVGLGHLRRLCPVHVDIDGRPHAQITRQQGRGTPDDPSVVELVEPLKQAVICHLPLQAIGFAQAELRGVRRQALGERPRVVEDALDRICDELADCLRVGPLREQIGRDPAPRRRRGIHSPSSSRLMCSRTSGRRDCLRSGRVNSRRSRGRSPMPYSAAAERWDTTPCSAIRRQAGTSGPSWSQAARRSSLAAGLRRDPKLGTKIQCELQHLGVSDGIRTHDIQDHNLAL